MPSKRDIPSDTKKALERYYAAQGHSTDPKVTQLRTQQAADEARAVQKAALKEEERKRRLAERNTGRINSMLTRYRQAPLEEVTPPPYDVAKVDCSRNKPPFFAPIKEFVRNVPRRVADKGGENGIEPATLKTWREQHLGMTVDQLAALIRVTSRTVRMWESGKSRIPFAMYWVMKQLQPSDLPEGFDASKPTRYAKPVMVDNGRITLDGILRRNAFIMKEHGVSALALQHWRLHMLYMSPEQLAELVRVPVKTVLAWESGETPIPFSMWWVMHSTLQDPAVFLTRPGFHNFYIDYYDGEAVLCSRTHPDIRYTVTELYTGKVALKGIEALHQQLEQQVRLNEELVAENTRLRQMAKTGAVAQELAAMQAHIADLLKRMNTADVLPFPETEPAGQVVDFPRQASA